MKFARVKEQLFDDWCRAKEVKEFESLRQLVFLEEFKRDIFYYILSVSSLDRGNKLIY